MIDLPKLELDEHYYLKLKNGKIEIQKFIGGFVLRNDDEIAGVLGTVPSYELWKAVHEQLKVLLKENAKLKDLLKECVDWLTYIDRDNGIIAKIDQVLGEE